MSRPVPGALQLVWKYGLAADAVHEITPARWVLSWLGTDPCVMVMSLASFGKPYSLVPVVRVKFSNDVVTKVLGESVYSRATRVTVATTPGRSYWGLKFSLKVGSAFGPTLPRKNARALASAVRRWVAEPISPEVVNSGVLPVPVQPGESDCCHSVLKKL